MGESSQSSEGLVKDVQLIATRAPFAKLPRISDRICRNKSDNITPEESAERHSTTMVYMASDEYTTRFDLVTSTPIPAVSSIAPVPDDGCLQLLAR